MLFPPGLGGRPPHVRADADFPRWFGDVMDRLLNHCDFVVSGELRLEGTAWILQARMSDGATGEVRWADSISVSTENADVSLQQTRIAAGVGHPLALRINAMINAGPGAPDRDLAGGSAKVVIEQAMASINQTTPERWHSPSLTRPSTY